MQKDILIKIKNLNFAYDGINVFKNFNLKIIENSLTLLTGPPGSGKSTLLHIISGILKTKTGIFYKNKKINAGSLRKKTSLLLQYPEDQIFETIVIDDIMFPYKLTKTKMDLKTVKEVMVSLNLSENYLNAQIKNLSFGILRKIALLEVLIRKMEILCLDEPLAGLDYKSKLNFINILNKLKKSGKTIIIASHQNNFFKDMIDGENNLSELNNN